MPHHTQNDVALLFNQAAQRYDAANDVMSAGMHRLWKRFFVRSLPVRRSSTWVDVGTGTGDIAIALCKIYAHNDLKVIACDPNKHMLDIAKTKAWDKGVCSITWHQTPGHALPCHDKSVDGILMSFALRNIVKWEEALREGFRCTKNGGAIRIMEFNALGPTTGAFFYEYYRKYIVPRLGALASGHQAPYTYLSESIRAFAPPKRIMRTLQDSGWNYVHAHPLLGGAVMIYQGEKR